MKKKEERERENLYIIIYVVGLITKAKTKVNLIYFLSLKEFINISKKLLSSFLFRILRGQKLKLKNI